jgi:hypothetical protein
VVDRSHPQPGVDLTYIKQTGESNGDAGDRRNVRHAEHPFQLGSPWHCERCLHSRRLGLWALSRRDHLPANKHSVPSLRKLDALVRMSEAGEAVSRQEPRSELTKCDLAVAREYVLAFPNRSAYHILLNIRRLDLEAYSSISDVIKARVLVNALSVAREIDDWGDLSDPTSVGEAGSSVLAVGRTALPLLLAILDDGTRIGSFEGEVQAYCDLTSSRRKDVAYKIISLILGRQPSYDPDPGIRNEAIEALKSDKAILSLAGRS